MSAGQPLFQTDVGPWKQHAFCLQLRTDAGEALFPPGGECKVDGFHWRLPPVNRATHRMLSNAYRLWSGQQHDGHPDAFVEAIGRAFCLVPDVRPVEVHGLWTWLYKHYDDGSELRRNGLLFGYSCDSGRLTELQWLPDDPSVEGFWGAPPWP
jgi:hypothetical protein